MPTYICYARSGLLTLDRRRQLAEGITDTHSRETGAPASFCQVLFQGLAVDGMHFIGGRPADPASVFISGHIREGRTEETLSRLMTELRDLVVRVAGVADEHVWVYLTELVPQQMIEFGQVLPEHGAEQAWLDSRPTTLRERLLAFEGDRHSPEPT